MNKMTKKQHFVPQVYQRGFSYNGKQIWHTDLSKREKKRIGIRDSASIKCLYEMKDEQGNIVNINQAESIFKEFEYHFNTYKDKILKKAFLEENQGKHCFLASDEKEFWYSWISIQAARTCCALRKTEEVLKARFPFVVNQDIIHNTALKYCTPHEVTFKNGVPILKKLPEAEKGVVDIINEELQNMCFVVKTAKEDIVITSDNPVFIQKLPNSKGYNQVIFPLTSRVVIWLYSKDMLLEKKLVKNSLAPMTDFDKEELSWAISKNADRYIISRSDSDKSC